MFLTKYVCRTLRPAALYNSKLPFLRTCKDALRQRNSQHKITRLRRVHCEVGLAAPAETPAAGSMDTIQNILVVIAMEAEAGPIIKELGLKKEDPPRITGPAPCEAFSGTFAGASVTVVHNGKDPSHGVDNVGTVPAALTSYVAIQAYKPDLLISAGTAGGFKAKGGEIGDVYVSTACVNHDRRIPLPGFDAYGLGIKQSASTENLQAQLPLKTGVVSSGNSLDYTEKCLEIMKDNFAAVKEMEAAGVAWVADLCGVPMFCVKAITDIVDGGRPSEEEFVENLSSAAQALKSMVPKVLEFVAGKKLTEL